jgi:very-short-patch-repair endonuclease
VTVATSSGRKQRPGLRIHRSHLPDHTTQIRDGIRVTTPARTLADLKRVVAPSVYRRALRQADYLGLPLEETPTDRTRSELERDFLRLCRRHRLPVPEVNVRIGPFTVDFLWPEVRLVVETDGYAAHRGRQAFEDDRARDLELRRRGYEVMRFTDSQIDGQPAVVAGAIRRAVKLIACPPTRARSGSPSSS